MLTVKYLSSVYGAVQDKSSEQQHKNDFIAFDLNQDAFVDASEVRSQFRGLKQEDISAFFIAADKDEDGLITFEEYLAASLRHDEGELDLDDYKFQWVCHHSTDSTFRLTNLRELKTKEDSTIVSIILLTQVDLTL